MSEYISPDIRALIDRLEQEQLLTKDEFVRLISGRSKAASEYLFEKAQRIRQRIYGREVYIRGLIEFTNYCRNDCYYCGIRRSNKKADRYRLTQAQILNCCRLGYQLGFRTFVLQGGQDAELVFFGLFQIVGLQAVGGEIHEGGPGTSRGAQVESPIHDVL
ncbi:MAG: [FeFe] hydrogenase H-cluster radical SAM maturase HydE, partial [Lachnospiraceae bacterium]|nr:[FeFe] hydrogenase H-cluster radical SAM maturase HydE [Lachnospiraceae bacterium]